ncbi:S-adenosyl-L-methionine-dependent methyltransferase [Glarea lozoyensis ATCC 20868]|uniref:S-adenosyl-L-methionine-dependent methyltransferase n=1 Tax=Glarea lozoyensis (strain ATCC 20868 / MF5171) TaxID=1116229 RepID=S3CQV8_GLAL2|nr:S-adenosyl-L-methionine-dependent methyltransferase [Glarea lozoyensis ATCC 20868]EPE27504.1 S-adenosyl-L-methionine-dependent methyltransferase [Glarea lozoyensis ATCC 20868]
MSRQFSSIAENIASLNALSSTLADDTDKTARKNALRLSKALVSQLEEPANIAVELAFSSLLPMSARVAVDMKLFEYISRAEKPVSVTELSDLSNAEAVLITRILRPLSATNFVREVSANSWEATPITHAMASEGIAAGHRMLWEVVIGAAVKAPKYFKEAGYRSPTSISDGIVQYAFQTKLPMFQYLSSMPSVLKDFNTFMGNTMGARNYWVDWYPCREQILDGATSEGALIVDVGGGRGHDVDAFRVKFPGSGRLVVQDLRPVIEGIEDLDVAIERQVYDFFTPQPDVGARVYFYHHILHDWSDEKCIEMLKSVRGAMKPGYSKLLLHEMIIPDVGASPFHAMLDLTMMTINGGMERTSKQWHELLEKAGLKVVKIWAPLEDDADGIVEAILEE